jgi:threonine/homoserine/homoserine lactone efflux protein
MKMLEPLRWIGFALLLLLAWSIEKGDKKPSKNKKGEGLANT